jgi:hypothetical protein
VSNFGASCPDTLAIVDGGAGVGAGGVGPNRRKRSVLPIVLFVLGGLFVAAGLIAGLTGVDLDEPSSQHCKGPALVGWVTNDEGPCRSEARDQFVGAVLFFVVGLILIVVATKIRRAGERSRARHHSCRHRRPTRISRSPARRPRRR